jgi:DNA-binding Xre family transcriptional regulator
MAARRPSIRWHLRQVMATKGMFATSDLMGPLAERGIALSREQVYRLVTGTPERLNTRVLAALCDILEVGVADLIEVVVEARPAAKVAGAKPDTGRGGLGGLRPTRARIVDGATDGPRPVP